MCGLYLDKTMIYTFNVVIFVCQRYLWHCPGCNGPEILLLIIWHGFGNTATVSQCRVLVFVPTAARYTMYLCVTNFTVSPESWNLGLNSLLYYYSPTYWSVLNWETETCIYAKSLVLENNSQIFAFSFKKLFCCLSLFVAELEILIRRV